MNEGIVFQVAVRGAAPLGYDHSQTRARIQLRPDRDRSQLPLRRDRLHRVPLRTEDAAGVSPVVLGMALMSYPVFIRSMVWRAAIGVCLTGGLWVWRD
ncbi:MAG: hypothetical protein E6J72_06915 [Deltaproteobacteria bacterium]|nr:MAG: hypothetical protein E6J72_06915 [Deltaproteobacteria bacterium]